MVGVDCCRIIICGFSKIFVSRNLREMSQNAVFLNFEMLLRAADYIEKRGNVKQKDRGSPVAAIEYRVVVSPVLNNFCSA